MSTRAVATKSKAAMAMSIPSASVFLQRQPESGRRLAAPGPSETPLVSHAAERQARPPLDPEARASGERALGCDFTKVPVHGNHVSTGPASTRTMAIVENHRQSFSATLRRVDRRSAANADPDPGERFSMRTGIFQNDAKSGKARPPEIDFAALAAQTPVAARAGPEPREGETIGLPDIVIPSMAFVGQTDAIAGTLTYNPGITQAGSPPPPFGETKPYTHALSGISVTRASGTFTVSATVDNPITFQVSGAGHTDISSDSDPDITKDNYTQVASDLTPDMSDENGRPPRTQFWAEDLTIKHERFHANEDMTYGRAGVVSAQNWMNTKTAASVADVNALLTQVPGRVANTVAAGMAFPGLEERAYGDGAPDYLARATAIKKKGDANGYGGGGGLSRGAKVGLGILGGVAGGALIGGLAGGGAGAAAGAGAGLVAGLIGGLLA